MSDWVGVVGTAVGALAGFAGALTVERQRTARDREAAQRQRDENQEAAQRQREENKQDLRDRIQRETLLDLQGAMVDLDLCMYRSLPPPYDRAPAEERGKALAELRGPALARVRVLQARVIDDKTRELVDNWVQAAANTVSMAADPDKTWDRMLEASNAFEAANKQLGLLLREVF